MKKPAVTPRRKYTLRLFVAGASLRSITAIQNVRRLCEEQLADRYQLEIIDIYQHPALARLAQIVATPTLVKEAPLPVRHFVGNFSDSEQLLQRLGR